MITFILAKDLDRRDVLASDFEPVGSVLSTDLGVSVGLAGELTNRVHFLPTDRVPVRGGIWEAVTLRGNYPGPVPKR